MTRHPSQRLHERVVHSQRPTLVAFRMPLDSGFDGELLSLPVDLDPSQVPYFCLSEARGTIQQAKAYRSTGHDSCRQAANSRAISSSSSRRGALGVSLKDRTITHRRTPLPIRAETSAGLPPADRSGPPPPPAQPPARVRRRRLRARLDAEMGSEGIAVPDGHATAVVVRCERSDLARRRSTTRGSAGQRSPLSGDVRAPARSESALTQYR